MKIQEEKMSQRSDQIQFQGIYIPKKTCSQHY